jgi:hypothetical protein
MSASCRFFAAACCSALLVGCAKDSGGTTASVPPPVASTARPPVDAAEPAPSAPSAAPADAQALDPYITAEPIKSKSVGHTSYVLKLTLAGGLVGAFKPRSRLPLGDRRYRGEIAAYRLAKALGLENVPRALPRSFDMAALGPLQDDLAAKALPDADGRLRGALMPWVEHYEVVPLEEPAWRARWEPWLTDPRAVVPDDQRALAAAISNMLVFDFVTGNWDRWSGGNVARDGATGLLLYVDNDGAFYDPPPADALARQLALLKRTVRYSRRFVGSLRALDPGKLRDIFGEESPAKPLLPDTVIAGVGSRIAAALAAIDAKTRDGGTDGFE